MPAPLIHARTLRAAVRPLKGAIRETPHGLEFFHTAQLQGWARVPVSVLIGVWDGTTWRPVVGDPAPCATTAEAVWLFMVGAARGNTLPQPATAAEVNRMARTQPSRQAGIATGRRVPRNGGFRHPGVLRLADGDRD